MKRLQHLLLSLLLIGCTSGTETSGQGSTAPTSTPTIPSRVGFAPTAPSPLVLAADDKRALLTKARAYCDGVTDALPASEALLALNRPVWAVLYTPDGTRHKAVRVEGTTSTLEDLKAGLPDLCKEAPQNARLHLMVVGYTARLPNYGIKGIFDNKVFEPMVNGVAYEYRGRRMEFDPLTQCEKNLNSRDVRNYLARGLSLDPQSIPTRNELIVEIYEVTHFGETRTTGEYSDFYRCHQPLPANSLTHEEIDRRLTYIGDWYRNNVIDGQVTYEYAPTTATYLNTERTMVRSTMSVWILNRLARHLKQADLTDLGALTIKYYLDTYFQIEKSIAADAIQPSPVALPNGNLAANRYTTASFIAAAIMEREDWKEQAKEVDLLMHFAMSYKRDDNLLWTDQGASQFFMPGQLLLAVSYAYATTGDEKYRVFFDEVFDTYAPTILQLMYLAPGTVTAYAPAWFTQPSTQMYLLTKDTKYRDFVYAINDRVVLHHVRNAAYQKHPDYDGILAPKLGSYGNNSITAAALESLVDAAITARTEGDLSRFKKYQTAIRHATAYLLRLQYTPDNAYYLPHRERVVGGFKKDLVNNHSWMDNVWHFTSALMKIQDARLLDASTDAPAPLPTD